MVEPQSYRVENVSDYIAPITVSSGHIPNDTIRKKISGVEFVSPDSFEFRVGERDGVWFMITFPVEERYTEYRFDRERCIDIPVGLSIRRDRNDRDKEKEDPSKSISGPSVGMPSPGR